MFTDILDSLMQERNINKHILAIESGIPYTTIDGFYKKGCDNIKLSTIRRLASYFGVSLDFLIDGDATQISSREKKLIAAYRAHPEMQSAVDKLLGISDDIPTVGEDIAATISAAVTKKSERK